MEFADLETPIIYRSSDELISLLEEWKFVKKKIQSERKKGNKRIA
jgi:hypothetical protein